MLNKAMRQFPFAVSLFPYLNVKIAPTVQANKMLSLKKLFQFLVIFLICVAIRNSNKKLTRQKGNKNGRLQNQEQNFHEVDAFGDDFVDFGAQTGDHGQFSWHADFPVDK